ncbi:MAG TPA: hypothetical protein VEI27_00555 [Dehalococcoidales bacterium]|nr:hypothetical protein [Dehalococcoidales bacterium]
MRKSKICLVIPAVLLVATLCSCTPKIPQINITVPSFGSSTQATTTTTGTSTTKNNSSYNYVLPDEYKTIFAQSDWVQNPSLSSGFMTGNTVTDWFSDIAYNKYLDPTLDSMQKSGGGWVAFDNYWSYYSLQPTVIGPFKDRSNNTFRDATADEIGVMIQKTHARGMKFALMSELNWDVMRGPWQGWDYQQQFATRSSGLIEQMGRDLSNPTDAVNQFWDGWFDAYSKFAIFQAQAAQTYGADMLVIGKQIDGAVSPGNEGRWKALIAAVRQVYKGPISYAAWTSETYTQAKFFPFDDLDNIIIYYYNVISSDANPSIADLKASFDQFNTSQFQPLSERFGKKVVFLTPFQSRDFGAKQEWFESSAPAPNVKEDLLIQAKMYEALFQSVRNQDWVQGIWTWGYWWRDDFDTMYTKGDSSFNKSSTIRNKPAMVIMQKWSGH